MLGGRASLGWVCVIHWVGNCDLVQTWALGGFATIEDAREWFHLCGHAVTSYQKVGDTTRVEFVELHHYDHTANGGDR